MQQITLTITDRAIEKKLADVTSYEGINIQDFIMRAIQTSLRQKTQTRDKLDPFEHSDEISCAISEDLSDIRPFSDVEDSAEFGKELRKISWERS